MNDAPTDQLHSGDAPTAAGVQLEAPPARSRTRWRKQQAPVPAPAPTHVELEHPTAKRARGFSTGMLIMLGVAVIVAIVGGAIATGAVQLQRPDDGSPLDLDGSSSFGSSFSYYHDTEYSADPGAAKWDTDRSRSPDPAEAALGTTSRWEYDGPYRYGTYGSEGLRQRGGGRGAADPLYSQSNPVPDVFSQAGDLDPSGGDPVGVAPSSLTSPYYDPYGGYSNPYANRIRLGYGEGIGRGASTQY